MEGSKGGIKKRSRLAVFEHVVEKEKGPKQRKFKSNRLDYDDSSPSESELVIDDGEPIKKKKNLVRLTGEPLNLLCEWNFCGRDFLSWDRFNNHLIEHVKFKPENCECLWTGCHCKSTTITLLIQHLSFHGYLTKLKNIGQNVLSRSNLPQCTLNEYYTVPIYPTGYSCEWENCCYNCNTIYEFYTHMSCHAKNNAKIATEERNEVTVCCWKGCNIKCPSQYKLAEHLRTHTKEKTVACPTCCSLFSSKTKFCDHRKRQLPRELQSYQCSQCLKLFPSERLLRDHMRAHINHYKCTICDMTCPKPSTLAKHMRFKHVNEKYYKCTKCSKTFVAKHNLSTHLKTHSKGENMQCDLCDFQCRTRVGLENHYSLKHEKHHANYECHCCSRKFKRGGYLTRHLMKLHNYHWPSGHSRFRYRKDQDGIYRLQTVRYESLEVTQEMIKSESMQTHNVIQSISYSLKYDNDGKSNYILSISKDGEESVKESEQTENNILITINDVDEQGNIVKSQVVEAGEIIETLVEKRVDQLPNLTDIPER